MRVLVRAMAKKLAARYAKTRRRRLRGQLDVRRTMRRNMGWGGVPFITVWKQKRIEKPRVMVLCDVSGSVAPMAQFLLMFLYAVHEALSDIRSFAFAGSTIEVSAILEKQEIEAAIDEIMKTIGYGSSNYGNALADFEDGWNALVTNKTTIIILGDARGNRTDPRTEIMARLSQRAKRIIWLNPEYRSAWGTGDSDMYRYAAFCNVVTVCNTLRHLERAVTDLLEDARVSRRRIAPVRRFSLPRHATAIAQLSLRGAKRRNNLPRAEPLLITHGFASSLRSSQCAAHATARAALASNGVTPALAAPADCTAAWPAAPALPAAALTGPRTGSRRPPCRAARPDARPAPRTNA